MQEWCFEVRQCKYKVQQIEGSNKQAKGQRTTRFVYTDIKLVSIYTHLSILITSTEPNSFILTERPHHRMFYSKAIIIYHHKIIRPI